MDKTSRRRLTPLQILCLGDLALYAAVCIGIAFELVPRHIPAWSLVLFMIFAIYAYNKFYRRLLAFVRLAKREGRLLTANERRTRYRWLCCQFAVFILILAKVIPFGFSTAAFWCIFISALVVLIVLLEATREELFRE